MCLLEGCPPCLDGVFKGCACPAARRLAKEQHRSLAVRIYIVTASDKARTLGELRGHRPGPIRIQRKDAKRKL